MVRFKRDELRTFPIWWLFAGGLFIFSTAWACYAEFVTRVPWQKEQDAFFRMEFDLATQGLVRAKNEFAANAEGAVKKQKERAAELANEQRTGKYAAAKTKLTRLNAGYANAEQEKTFGKSDLDEAYYYRELAEYQRDAAEARARSALSLQDPEGGRKRADQLLADPPRLAPVPGVSSDMLHLREEIARNSKRADQIEQAQGSLGPASANLRVAWDQARDAERLVVAKVKGEVVHQERVDRAVNEMARIEGPADPASDEKNERAQLARRAEACAQPGARETRHCLQWLDLDPVDLEVSALERSIAKAERPVEDAKLRLTKADERAHTKLDPKNLIASLVGPYQIEQVVTHWQEAEADVDREAVDRCTTCHMGTDSANYSAANLPRQFRSHPFRKTLFATHPVEKFGCTPCHQGEGRATDALAHSRTRFQEKSVTGPRWVHQGDEFWEDTLYPLGDLHHVVIGEENDSFQIKIGQGSVKTIEIPHKNAAVYREKVEARARDRHAFEDYATESDLFGQIETLVGAALEKDDAATFHAVVRKNDNRVEIGVEPNDPSAFVDPKKRPKVKLKFPKPATAELLGFAGVSELDRGATLYVSPAPPQVPVSSEAAPSWDKNGRYTPPTARRGLQVPAEFRDRFIQGIPELESGCLRCHGGDVDLRPHRSKAKYVLSKLDRQRAEASHTLGGASPSEASSTRAHATPEDLPEVLPDPASDVDPVPALSEGRYLFKKLNCTGCHILEGVPGNRNAGPQLNDITSKVSPEWLLKWIRYPRAWRHKTRMPNFWPAPIDPASKLPYPAGSPEYLKWEEGMHNDTLAIASYLVERSEHPLSRPQGAKEKPLAVTIQGYGSVDGANAAKGKQYFDAYGCRGCHVTSEDNPPPPWRGRERDVAPTLANLGNKMNADWLTYWIEDPSRYWHGTRMPKLRLSRLEAASVAQYLLTLKDEPKDAASASPDEVGILSNEARRKEKVACDVVAPGTKLERDKCGEKLIGYYGCFGCHDIAGFENYAPIAPELTGWAKKDTSKLDYGYALDDHHLQTHETFLTWKLDSPRIYRRDRIELRMADFDLSPSEIRALSVFVMGLVESKPLPEYNPSSVPEYAAVLEGRQIVDDYNCRGCHVIEDRGGDFAQATKLEHAQNAPPFLAGEGMRVQPEWLFHFVRDPAKSAIRPFLHPEWVYGEGNVPSDKLEVRMPTFPLSPEQTTALVRYFAAWDGQRYPYRAPEVAVPTPEQKLYVATHMNSGQHANCVSCHFVGEFPVARGKEDLQKMAPNLGNVAARLRPEWVKAWLSAPMNWLPYTKMLTLWAEPYGPPLPWDKVQVTAPPQSAEDQIEMVRNFLFTLQPDSVWPKAGDEAKSPLVQSEDAVRAVADKDDKKEKGKVKAPKRHGSTGGPQRG